MLAICTRTKNDDYTFHGNTNSYEEFKRNLEPIKFLLDTTKPLVIIQGNRLFACGIATERKDKVDTPIRYSFFYSGEESKRFFSRLQSALSHNKAQSLGKALDSLLKINPEAEELTFVMPAEEAFLNILEKELPPAGFTPEADFALWSEFCPTEKDNAALEAFLQENRDQLPASGTVEVANLGKIDLSKLAQKKSQHPGSHKLIHAAIAATIGFGLGLLTSYLTQSLPEPKKTTPPVAELKPIFNPTALVVLEERQIQQLQQILAERHLREPAQYQRLRIKAFNPNLNQETELLLVPAIKDIIVSPEQPGTSLTQVGPISLTVAKEVREEEQVQKQATPIIQEHPVDKQEEAQPKTQPATNSKRKGSRINR